MFRLIAAVASRLRQLISPHQRDRGEVGPIGYTVMVAGIVLLALLVVGWGESIANYFMSEVDLGDGGN